MTYRAAWYLADAVTPAPGLDLGDLRPGETRSVSRLLRNIGDQPLSAVQWTLEDDVPGVTVTVDGVTLTPGVTHTTPALPPGAGVPVTAARTAPADAPPGLGSAFLTIRALT